VGESHERQLDGCVVRWEDSLADPRLTVAVAGEIDMANATEWRELVVPLVRREQLLTVCVDLGEVTFIDSSGLSSLLALKAETDSAGVSLELTKLTADTRRLFESAGLVTYLNLPPS
jgi:anti-anti-sigma factor